MFGEFTYLAIILVPGLLANLGLWAFGGSRLKPHAKAILTTVIAITLYWAAIDFVAIRFLGIWTFRPEHTTGIMILGLLLEEWLLFILSGGMAVSF
ncbi:MAG: hypothetical protein K0S20_399, partial [Patescibacteria group bacterium]|nr:hypothetical protein [Patescibacteria group bacterium]